MSVFLSRLLVPVLAFFCGFLGDERPAQAEEKVFIPGYWDLRRRAEKPDVSRIRQIRFLTESDYPPFHFIGPNGMLTGFEVDLARASCEVLGVTCTIQPHRWDRLLDALRGNVGDAVIAMVAITPENRRQFLLTSAYHRTPARFVVPRTAPGGALGADALKGKRVAVVVGSTHEAYLRAHFPTAVVVAEPNIASVLTSVQYGGVAAAFVDGVSAAFWLNGEASGNCCRFAGGAFTESRYFGEGAGIVVRRDSQHIQQALDWALQRLASDGTYATLYLKYFPVGIY